jgi:hypothetical protein
VGLRNCLLDINKAGRYNITFTVANSLGLRATVQRFVVVQDSCVTGEALCQDGTCSAGTLDTAMKIAPLLHYETGSTFEPSERAFLA